MKPCLVFQSDFTYKEGAVAAMYGVVKQVDPSLEIHDLTHEIPQFDIWSASFRLHQVMTFWPKGTIFVSVVDPGVGTTRKACVAVTKSGHLIVTPDNKTLTHVDHFIGLEKVIEIDPQFKFKSQYQSSVFHGRDIFGYVAALLASGQESLDSIGKEYSDIQRFDLPEATVENGILNGILEIQDPNFGNVWTNIPYKQAIEAGYQTGDRIEVCIYHNHHLHLKQHLHFGSTFGSVDLYEPILYINELECLALALNQSHFAHQYNCGQGPDWTVTIQKENYV